MLKSISWQDQLRYRQIDRLLGRAERVLDIGCGQGNIMQYLQKTDRTVIGLDSDKERLAQCRQKGLPVYDCDVENQVLPKGLNNFDAVLMAEVLEHVCNPDKVLKKVSCLLKPGGHLLVSVPNAAYLKHRLCLLMGKMPDFGDDLMIKKQADYHLLHKTHFSLKTIVMTLQKNGFKVQKIEPTQGVVSFSWLRWRIFDWWRQVWPSLWAGGLSIVARKD